MDGNIQKKVGRHTRGFLPEDAPVKQESGHGRGAGIWSQSSTDRRTWEIELHRMPGCGQINQPTMVSSADSQKPGTMSGRFLRMTDSEVFR